MLYKEGQTVLFTIKDERNGVHKISIKQGVIVEGPNDEVDYYVVKSEAGTYQVHAADMEVR